MDEKEFKANQKLFEAVTKIIEVVDDGDNSIEATFAATMVNLEVVAASVVSVMMTTTGLRTDDAAIKELVQRLMERIEEKTKHALKHAPKSGTQH